MSHTIKSTAHLKSRFLDSIVNRVNELIFSTNFY